MKRRAKLVSVEQKRVRMPDDTIEEREAGGSLMWVAVDSDGRSFVSLVKERAIELLERYNQGKHP